ncbi:MAG: SDR family NAD(P)-dependent oxidoreductase [bacterium]|nr:SDR family NAD(P)-dependent oxidoreductase [bacterium]
MSEISFPLPNASTDLDGRVALVTGATAGLGWRFALVLASAGAKVAIAGRRVARLESLAELVDAAGGECLPVPLDITDDAAFGPALDRVASEFGLVTILVNNAGIPDARRAHRMPTELVDAVLATNLRGPYLLACSVARRLIESGTPGRIVNISSMAAYHYDGIGAALYSTTKAALNRMTETLAVEWARYGINVNAIAPGVFLSEMTEAGIERMGDPSPRFPRKRICDPAQLDSTLLYLTGPASECVTGTIVKVDDGQFSR